MTCYLCVKLNIQWFTNPSNNTDISINAEAVHQSDRRTFSGCLCVGISSSAIQSVSMTGSIFSFIGFFVVANFPNLISSFGTSTGFVDICIIFCDMWTTLDLVPVSSAIHKKYLKYNGMELKLYIRTNSSALQQGRHIVCAVRPRCCSRLRCKHFTSSSSPSTYNWYTYGYQASIADSYRILIMQQSMHW